MLAYPPPPLQFIFPPPVSYIISKLECVCELAIRSDSGHFAPGTLRDTGGTIHSITI